MLSIARKSPKSEAKSVLSWRRDDRRQVNRASWQSRCESTTLCLRPGKDRYSTTNCCHPGIDFFQNTATTSATSERNEQQRTRNDRWDENLTLGNRDGGAHQKSRVGPAKSVRAETSPTIGYVVHVSALLRGQPPLCYCSHAWTSTMHVTGCQPTHQCLLLYEIMSSGWSRREPGHAVQTALRLLGQSSQLSPK